MAVEHISKGNDDGTTFGQDTSDLISFYGVTPVAQRSSSNQATTNIAVSASFGASQLAVVQEIMNTLAAVGLWKGSA